jgi:site-specific DNA-cytosine methylase
VKHPVPDGHPHHAAGVVVPGGVAGDPLTGPVDVDLFAGPGGLDEGRRLAGHATVPLVGIEWERWACRTAAAAGHTRVRADVAALDPAPLAGRVRLLLGSPPCQAWSMAGKRGGEQDRAACHELADRMAAGDDTTDWHGWADPRSPLVCQPVRWIREVRPEAVVLEEVPPVASLWEHFARILTGWRYHVWTGDLNAADYGVPQTRVRRLLIASRTRPVGPPEPTHARHPADDLFGRRLLPWVSMAAALGWDGDGVHTPARTVNGHHTPRWLYADPDGTRGRTVVVNTRGDRAPGGGNEFPTDQPSWALTKSARTWELRVGTHERATRRPLDEPSGTLFFGHQGNDVSWVLRTGNNTMRHSRNGSRAGDGGVVAYERDLTEPAPTLDTATGAKWTLHRPATTVQGDPRIAPPGHRDRTGGEPAFPADSPTGGTVRITIAEAATLQGFPAGYPWQGNRTRVFEQIGNAVPPPLAAHCITAALGTTEPTEPAELATRAAPATVPPVPVQVSAQGAPVTADPAADTSTDAAVAPLDEASAPDHTDHTATPGDVGDVLAPETGSGGRSSDSQASKLVGLAVGRYSFVQGDDGRPYAVDRDGPNIALPLRGRDGLRQRLARTYYEKTGIAAGGSALADALTVIEGMAADAPAVPVGLRTARHRDGIVLDLGQPGTGRAVLIQPGRWQLVDGSPVLFRRTTLTGALPTPTATGGARDPAAGPDALAGFRALLNVNDAGFRLIVAWLLAALVPDVPHPILALLGEQGTAKSTAAKFAVRLIDPSPAPLRTPPKDVRAWAVTASASWTVALDNVSTIPPWFSDTLCKAVTGDGIVERALFTDDDVTVLTFRRVIALTSIDAGSLAGDLAERMIPVELHTIPKNQRRPEAEIEDAFTAAAPAALGGLLDLLAAVLAALPEVLVESLPRMADFARLLAALDAVTGWQTLSTYLTAAAETNNAVIDADPFATAVVELVRGQTVGWTGTATELHAAISPEHPPRGWPASPRSVAGHLRRIAPALRSAGIDVDHGRTGAARLITLRPTNPPDDPAAEQPPANDADPTVTTVITVTKPP